jgi:hypothetical protein
MRKYISGVLFLTLIMILLFGCLTGSHNTNLVKKYIKENISKSSINIGAQETDADGTYWIINFEDKPDYKFWVESRKYSSFGIPMGYHLGTNFNTIFAYYYLNEFKESNSCLISSKLNRTIHTIARYYIECYYSSREEAIILANDINKYCDFVNKQAYPCEIEIWCYYIPAQNDDQIKNYRLKIYSSKEYAREIDWTSPNDNLARYLYEINIEKELIKHIENYNEIKKDYEEQIKKYGKILNYRN